MKPDRRFADHPFRCPGPSPYHMTLRKGQDYKADAGCSCGIKGPHRHCKLCGRCTETGTGEVIAEWNLPIQDHWVK